MSNQGVGDFRFINILKLFSIYFFFFFSILFTLSFFFYTFFNHDIYPHPHPRPNTHYPRPLPTTHDPRHLATLVHVGKTFIHSFDFTLMKRNNISRFTSIDRFFIPMESDSSVESVWGAIRLALIVWPPNYNNTQ